MWWKIWLAGNKVILKNKRSTLSFVAAQSFGQMVDYLN
jgi:hypothetical protein